MKNLNRKKIKSGTLAGTVGNAAYELIERLEKEGRLLHPPVVAHMELLFVMCKVTKSNFYVHKEKDHTWRYPIPACKLLKELFQIIEKETGHNGLTWFDAMFDLFLNKRFTEFKPEEQQQKINNHLSEVERNILLKAIFKIHWIKKIADKSTKDFFIIFNGLCKIIEMSPNSKKMTIFGMFLEFWEEDIRRDTWQECSDIYYLPIEDHYIIGRNYRKPKEITLFTPEGEETYSSEVFFMTQNFYRYFPELQSF